MNDYYLERSDKKNKKWMVSFITDKNRIKTIHFGFSPMQDYTQHKNKDRRDRYEKRHKVNENFNNVKTPAFWAYNLLWNPFTSSFKKAIKLTEKKYNIKIHLII